jgi:hypothetical protein
MFSRSFIVLLLVALVLAPALFARDPQATPLMRSAEPTTAKAGDEIVVTGDNLGKDLVTEVYLTDRTDKPIKVTVTEQTETTVKFKVPATVKAGKYWVMVLANMKEPLLIEEPVRLMIE